MHTWRVAALFSGLLVLYCFTLTQVNVVNDVDSADLASWRIATTGAPWLDGVPVQDLADQETVWVDRAENGHMVSFRAPGPILAGVPGYLAARALGLEGYSVVPGGIVAAFLSVGALLLIFLALRGRLGTVVSGGAVAILGLTTPVWSVSADGLWTHPVTILGIAGMTYACVRERWWLVGLCGGVAIWGRLHTAVIVAVLGLGLAWSRRRPGIALAAGSVSAALLALSAVWSHWMYGTWSLAGGYSVSSYSERALGSSGRGFLDQTVNHLGLWVSPDRGILIWSPMLVLLFPALVRSWRGLPDWSRWLLVGGVAYTLVQGQLNGFSGGSGFFGYRLTLELLVCAAPAYSCSLDRMGAWARRLVGPVIGLQFGAFALGSIGQGAILNEEHLWTQNAYVYALIHYPVLIMWLVLTVFLGWAVAKVVRDRMSAEGPVQALVS